MQLADMARRRASCTGTSRRQCHQQAGRSPPTAGSPLVPVSPTARLVTVHAQDPAPLHIPKSDYAWLRALEAAGTSRRRRHHPHHAAQNTEASPADTAPASPHPHQDATMSSTPRGFPPGVVALPPAIIPKHLPAPPKFPSPLVDVIFFPEPGGKLPCRDAMKPFGCSRHNCEYAHGPTHLGHFLEYLGSARETLDVCVFTITCEIISTKVIDLFNSGVKVRIITDDDQAKSAGSDVYRFREAGIPVKVDHNKAHMHNKWCIIDGKIFMGGSFNWTRQAVVANQENVTVLDDPKLVASFVAQFKKLWDMYYA